MLMHVTNDIKCGVQVFFQYRKMHIHRTSRLYSGDVGGIQAVRKDMVGYLWKIGDIGMYKEKFRRIPLQ